MRICVVKSEQNTRLNTCFRLSHCNHVIIALSKNNLEKYILKLTVSNTSLVLGIAYMLSPSLLCYFMSDEKSGELYLNPSFCSVYNLRSDSDLSLCISHGEVDR